MHSACDILPLRDAIDLSAAGGKAVNLAAMIRAGLPVPDGFVVTTTAFQKRGHNHEVPNNLKEQVRAAYQALGAPLVAARSSATAEDLAEASMAGQYETYLNLATPEDVIESISKCWASFGSKRVQSYLSEQGIPHDSVSMAVVVQRLVPADTAGVLFTSNPRTGSNDEMLIEASWGLGESVVSGEVQPDIIRVDKAFTEVRDYAVADKRVRLVPGGTNMEPVPDSLRTRACLNYQTIKELCRLGRIASRHFDKPQDIEWAVSNGSVFVLQSRAITTLDDAAAFQELLAGTQSHLESKRASGRGPWVRHNLDETLPNPTPLTWNIVRRFMSGEGGFGNMYRDVGFEPGESVAKSGFLEIIGAGIYMDCSRSPKMFSENHPFTYDETKLRENPDAAQQPPTVPVGGLSARTEAARIAKTVSAKLREEATTLDQRFDKSFVPEILAWCRTEEARDLQGLDTEGLLELWKKREQKVMDDFGATAFLPSMIEAMASADLHSFLAETFWDEDPDELAHSLGTSSVPDRTLTANAELRETALGKRTIEQWLSDHGHRAPGEFDLATRRWSERPDDLRHLASQLADSPDPIERHRERLSEAEACLRRLQSSLPDGQRGELERQTRLLQRYARFREDGKYYLMRAYAVLRQTIIEMERRLREDAMATGGKLESGDIFYLTAEEVFQTLRTGYLPEDRIAHERARHRAAERFHTPRVISDEEIPSLGTPTQVEGTQQWAAHPVSCGVSSGPARIVLQPESTENLGTGYVLICPSTDPSWTPLFANAAALILERGGTLSHGAIVAREMGLPAVVLEGATSLFIDGETLTVDSNGGQVSRAQPDVERKTSSAPVQEDPSETRIDRRDLPPPASRQEQSSAHLALMASLVWGLFIGAFYFFPTEWVHAPAFRLIDFFVWPLIPKLGYVGTVAFVGAAFSLLLLLGQKRLTDNARLFEAKRRAARLRERAKTLPIGSPRRLALESQAAPVTGRLLKASMIPLGWLLGPMLVIFLWFPERVDPAVWSADPGSAVSVLVEVEGDFDQAITLEVSEGIQLLEGSAASQSIPPIRQELEALRAEWQVASDLDPYPWDLQSAADHARTSLLGSLDAYLRAGVPAQKLSWRLKASDQTDGLTEVKLLIPGEANQTIPLVFGRSHPPLPSEFAHDGGAILSLKVEYPRALTQRVFWQPLKAISGPAWDFGWLGVYLLAYLGIMFGLKPAFRIP